MKIAVPITANNQIDDHFGHCEQYGIFTVSEKNEIENVQMISSVQGCGCKSDIASTLASMGVTTMLAGGIGGGAINVLSNAGIQVIRGCSGQASEAVKQYLVGTLADSGSSCQQHDHHHGHSQSGEHRCSH